MEAVQPSFAIVKGEEVEAFARELVRALVERLKDCDEEDIQEIEKITVEMLGIAKIEGSAEAKKAIAALIIRKQLRSESLKKKIEAMNILKESYKVLQTRTLVH